MKESPNMDRHLIADVIERAVRRDPHIGTWSALERAVRVSHSQMHRVKTGSPNVSAAMFQRIEAVLGLPMDTLHTIGVHDIDGLRELGVPADLVEWVAARVIKSSENGAGLSNAL